MDENKDNKRKPPIFLDYEDENNSLADFKKFLATATPEQLKHFQGFEEFQSNNLPPLSKIRSMDDIDKIVAKIKLENPDFQVNVVRSKKETSESKIKTPDMLIDDNPASITPWVQPQGFSDMSEALKTMKQMRDDNFGQNEKNSDNKPT